jgi:hypothetical protein
MQESLSPEHGGELLGDPLEQFLDGGGVSCESANSDIRILKNKICKATTGLMLAKLHYSQELNEE